MTAERCQLISYIAEFVTIHFMNLMILFSLPKLDFIVGWFPFVKWEFFLAKL